MRALEHDYNTHGVHQSCVRNTLLPSSTSSTASEGAVMAAIWRYRKKPKSTQKVQEHQMCTRRTTSVVGDVTSLVYSRTQKRMIALTSASSPAEVSTGSAQSACERSEKITVHLERISAPAAAIGRLWFNRTRIPRHFDQNRA